MANEIPKETIEVATKALRRGDWMNYDAQNAAEIALEAAASIKPAPSHVTVWEAVDDLHMHYLNAKVTKANLRRLEMLTEIKEMLEAEWVELGSRAE